VAVRVPRDPITASRYFPSPVAFSSFGVTSPSALFLRTPVIILGSPQIIQDNLSISSSLITSAKSFLPYKVTFAGSRDYGVCIWGTRHSPYHRSHLQCHRRSHSQRSPRGSPSVSVTLSLEASAGRTWAAAPLGQCAGVSPGVAPVTRPHPGILNMPSG